ncbi:AAA family ATPase [Pseudomonas citronellolis]|uniref:AAA family ATPase n=1 Tax=Pseudomonas citronellolis TaxID=53408 RepID=UPI003C2EC23C
MPADPIAIMKRPVSPLWRAELTPASTIAPKPIRWLWPGWIARGKLTLLAGAGGSGKTTLAMGLIGTITSGGRWPDGERCQEPGNALIWSSEDDPADTLVPRLMAAGADLARVHIIQGRINALGEREPFDPASDFDLLREAVESIGGAALLLLDPVVNVVKGDMHRANEVRRSLQAVVDFAEQQWCAVLGISHFSKGSGGTSPADRVIGSQAFGALARAVLVAAKQEDSDVRVLARAKSNISDDQGGVGYLVETCTVGDGLETTRVLWGDRIEGSAREILADVENTGEGDGRSELDEACDFLRDLLADGAVPTKRIKADADGAGHSWATIRRAQKVVGAEAIRIGEEGRKGGGTWYWELSCSSPLEHLKRRQPEHVNEPQQPRGFQPYEDDPPELSCSGNTVSTLIENLVIGPDEEGF